MGRDDARFERWLVQLINSPLRERWPERLRLDAARFVAGAGPRLKGAPRGIPLAGPIHALNDVEMGEVASLARALRGGETELKMQSPSGLWFFAARGRLLATPMLWEMSPSDGFLWRVYAALSAADVRVKFCAWPDCGRAFIARKRQAYCRPSHTVPVAERGRRYRRTRRARFVRHARYERQKVSGGSAGASGQN